MERLDKRKLFLLAISALAALIVVIAAVLVIRGEAGTREGPQDQGPLVPEGQRLVEDLYEGRRLIPDFDIPANTYDTAKFVEDSGLIRYQDGAQQVLLNGEDVSGQIRTEEVGKTASVVSAYMPVREKLTELQKELAARENVIMDGRDIGTCVLPQAPAKIYLTASVEVRALRRFRELTEKGEACDLEEIKKDIADRDWKDMHREHAPLKQAEDAVVVDSSNMSIDQVVEAILAVAKEKGLKIAGDCEAAGAACEEADSGASDAVRSEDSEA